MAELRVYSRARQAWTPRMWPTFLALLPVVTAVSVALMVIGAPPPSRDK